MRDGRVNGLLLLEKLIHDAGKFQANLLRQLLGRSAEYGRRGYVFPKLEVDASVELLHQKCHPLLVVADFGLIQHADLGHDVLEQRRKIFCHIFEVEGRNDAALINHDMRQLHDVVLVHLVRELEDVFVEAVNLFFEVAEEARVDAHECLKYLIEFGLIFYQLSEVEGYQVGLLGPEYFEDVQHILLDQQLFKILECLIVPRILDGLVEEPHLLAITEVFLQYQGQLLKQSAADACVRVALGQARLPGVG